MFNYEEKDTVELMRLHATGALTEVAYNELESELKKRGCQVPERPIGIQLQSKRNSIRGCFSNFYCGRRSLKAAFLFLGVFFNVIFYVLALMLTAVLGATFKVKSEILLNLSVFLFYIPYVYFMLVSIWRCSENTKYEFVGFLSRVFIALFSIHLLWLTGMMSWLR